MAQPSGGRSRSSVRPLPAPTDLPPHDGGTPSREENEKRTVRTGKTIKRGVGAAASGGVSAGVVTAVLKSPLIGWLLIGASLTVLLMVGAVLIVVLIGPDAHRSRFDRVMSFIGLLLRRAPARYMPAPTHLPAPKLAPRTMTSAATTELYRGSQDKP